MKLRQTFYGYLLFLCFGPVILVSPSKNVNCGNMSASKCLKDLQTFLHLTALPFTSEKSTLDSWCNTLVEGYNCSTKLVQSSTCLTEEEKGLFPVFMNMAEFNMLLFCKSEPGSEAYLRDALLENSECILKQKDNLDCCAKRSQVPDLPIMYILDQSSKSLTARQITACCPTSNYIKCVETVVRSNCGDDAGNFSVTYIRRSSGEQMEAVCQKLDNYPDRDPAICVHPAPICAGCSRIGTFMELTAVLVSFLVVAWMSRG